MASTTAKQGVDASGASDAGRVSTGVSTVKALRQAKGDYASAKQALQGAKVARLQDRIQKSSPEQAAKLQQRLERMTNPPTRQRPQAANQNFAPQQAIAPPSVSRDAPGAPSRDPGVMKAQAQAMRDLANAPNKATGDRRLLPSEARGAQAHHEMLQAEGKRLGVAVTPDKAPKAKRSFALTDLRAWVKPAKGPTYAQAERNVAFAKMHADYAAFYPGAPVPGRQSVVRAAVERASIQQAYKQAYGTPAPGTTFNQMRGGVDATQLNDLYQKMTGVAPRHDMSPSQKLGVLRRRQELGDYREAFPGQKVPDNLARVRAGNDWFKKGRGGPPGTPMTGPAVLAAGVLASGFSRAYEAKAEGKSGQEQLVAGMKAAATQAATPLAVGAGLVGVGKLLGIGAKAVLGRALLPASVIGTGAAYGYQAYKEGKSDGQIALQTGRGMINGLVPVEDIYHGGKAAVKLAWEHWKGLGAEAPIDMGQQQPGSQPGGQQQGRMDTPQKAAFNQAEAQHAMGQLASAAPATPGKGGDDANHLRGFQNPKVWQAAFKGKHGREPEHGGKVA